MHCTPGAWISKNDNNKDAFRNRMRKRSERDPTSFGIPVVFEYQQSVAALFP